MKKKKQVIRSDNPLLVDEAFSSSFLFKSLSSCALEFNKRTYTAHR